MPKGTLKIMHCMLLFPKATSKLHGCCGRKVGGSHREQHAGPNSTFTLPKCLGKPFRLPGGIKLANGGPRCITYTLERLAVTSPIIV